MSKDLPQGSRTSFIPQSGSSGKIWSLAALPPEALPALQLCMFHFLGHWLHRRGGAGQVGLPGPWYLGWKYFSFYFSTLVPFLFVYIYIFTMHTLKLCFSLQLSVRKVPVLKVKCAVVKGVGRRWGSARPRSTLWLWRLSRQTPKSGPEPNSLFASSDGIPRSHYQLVRRNHSRNCKLASKNCRDSFTWMQMPANII